LKLPASSIPPFRAGVFSFPLTPPLLHRSTASPFGCVEVSADFVKRKHIDSILLCPGFRHSDVAEIAKTIGSNVAVAVARGDGPSSKVSQEARKREGYFTKRGKD